MRDLIIVRPRVSSIYKRTIPFAAAFSVATIASSWKHRAVGWGMALIIAATSTLAMTLLIGTVFYFRDRKRWVTISTEGLQAPDHHGIQRDGRWDAIEKAEAVPEERGGFTVNIKIRHLPVTLIITSAVIEQPTLLPAVMRHVPWDHPLAEALREAGA